VRQTLDANNFRLISMSKTEYIKCDFNANAHEKGMLDSIVLSYQERHLSLLVIDAPEG
jgi:hypothetical protein